MCFHRSCWRDKVANAHSSTAQEPTAELRVSWQRDHPLPEGDQVFHVSSDERCLLDAHLHTAYTSPWSKKCSAHPRPGAMPQGQVRCRRVQATAHQYQFHTCSPHGSSSASGRWLVPHCTLRIQKQVDRLVHYIHKSVDQTRQPQVSGLRTSNDNAVLLIGHFLS